MTAYRHEDLGLAWHDVTCPEGTDCRSRSLHALSQPVVNSGHAQAFLDRLENLADTAECGNCKLGGRWININDACKVHGDVTW